jgi:superfamily II DNA/RNA helicase
MLATEAAAKGINLQFCSLVINYGLPWNPQRIEQRIGRCHRYGQKYDVVVINFLNERNEADRRVLELLAEKFNLFSGVFGASDEVLGTIESGVDFEKRILAIYQECRTPKQIEAAFLACSRRWMSAFVRAWTTHAGCSSSTSTKTYTSGCGCSLPTRKPSSTASASASGR